jgi:fimbrial chaperone protein
MGSGLGRSPALHNKKRSEPMPNRFFLKAKFPVNLNSLFIALLAFCSIGTTAHTQDLLLAPFRVVFDGSTRAQEVALVNRGNKRGTYRIEFVNMVMNDKGDLVESDTADQGEKFAKDMLRSSVRQIELDAGETQMIRIALRKPADLAAGEYRSHMLVRSLPKLDPPQLNNASSNEVSFKLMPAFGMTIPVLVRQGRPDAAANIASAKLSEPDSGGWSNLVFDIQRKGERSMFVDVDVVAQPDKGKGIWVTSARGISVYAPYATRRMDLQLNKAQADLLRGKKIRFLLTEIDINGKQISKTTEAMF